MSIDQRTRLHKDRQDLQRDQVLDSLLPAAITRFGDVAARGLRYKELPALGLLVDGRGVTLSEHGDSLVLVTGVARAGVVAELAADALSDLVQDWQSTMGLAMTARVKISVGTLDDWIGWEPVLRALLDGRRVHETGDVTFSDAEGGELDLDRSFSIDDDRAEMAHFLSEAGFLHVEHVFDEAEMAGIGDDIDEWIGRATPDDGESWWAEDSQGTSQAVRVLFFYEKSEALRRLLADERFQRLADLTGEGHAFGGGGEGLVKPLDIVKGLSDLPWHKDCGQGMHSYVCNSMTTGISVTGADRRSGALGVIPGSHRANTIATMRDRRLDLAPRLLETRTGDVTVHCSDTLHRAHPPIERPRKVVYTGFRLPPLEDDEVKPNPRYSREARAQLTDVTERIEAADNAESERRFRARPG
ncbi:MAG: phytanoyl-CoA dioxygenase family protein [Acidimicrobiia bacterium]|nr:phytanoyl-CoA dioxygenase family protein [Acidimicrobiia bacterium]